MGRARLAAIEAALALLTLAVFLEARHHEFVNLDDGRGHGRRNRLG